MAEKIDAIKEELTATPTEALEAFVEKYASDSRTGVQKLVDTAKKRMDKLQKEMIRTENLKKYEKEYDTYTYICGIDEVGRGPLAGPVVAGAVILPKDYDILYINDSKKLSAAKREELYDIIMEQAVATGLGTIGPDGIDEINILQATYEAMRQAIAQSKDFIASCRIKSCCRLVQNQHIRFHCKYSGDCHTALLSAGQIKRRLIK